MALLLLSSSFLMAQNTNWDKVLDEYEHICNECIIIRTRIAQGETVSYSSVTAIVKKLSELRNSLQQSSGSMNPDQVRRFSQIRDRYGAVMGTFVPSQMDDVKKGSTTIVASDAKSARKSESDTKKKGNQTDSPNSSLVDFDNTEMLDTLQLKGKDFLNLLEDETAQTFLSIEAAGFADSEPSGMPVSPSDFTFGNKGDLLNTEKGLGSFDNYVLISLEMGRKPSFGVFYGLIKDRFGGFIQGRSNFKTAESVGQVLSNGSILPDGGSLAASGKSAFMTWNVTAGPMFLLTDWLQLFVGAGYGQRRLSWQDTSGKWMEVKDFSSRGIALEGGVIVSYKSLCLGVGLCYLGEMDATAVIGIRF